MKRCVGILMIWNNNVPQMRFVLRIVETIFIFEPPELKLFLLPLNLSVPLSVVQSHLIL